MFDPYVDERIERQKEAGSVGNDDLREPGTDGCVLSGKMDRLWKGDKSLWTNDDEDKWLGWLHVAEDRIAHLQELTAFADEVCPSGGGITAWKVVAGRP